jgi:hypothetical protein
MIHQGTVDDRPWRIPKEFPRNRPNAIGTVDLSHGAAATKSSPSNYVFTSIEEGVAKPTENDGFPQWRRKSGHLRN